MGGRRLHICAGAYVAQGPFCSMFGSAGLTVKGGGGEKVDSSQRRLRSYSRQPNFFEINDMDSSRFPPGIRQRKGEGRP